MRPIEWLLILSFLSAAPSGAFAQTSQAPVSIKRNYPGGRDESDLTVQPKKRIFKKEVEDHGDDYDEGDFEQGDTGSGFGE